MSQAMMTAAYYEIAGSRRYEYRYESDGKITGWQDAGNATAETLARIEAGLTDVPFWEVREVCALAAGDGVHAGRLIFSTLVKRHESEEP